MRLSIRIATRFLRSSIGQTTLIVVGIAIGVSVQIFIGSLIQGLQKDLLDKTIGNSPHITVSSLEEDRLLRDYDQALTEMAEVESIRTVSPSYDAPAFLLEDDTSISLLVRGMSLSDADRIYQFQERLTSGRLPEQLGEVIIGESLAEEYGIALQDRIRLFSPAGQEMECVVTGLFDLQVASINNSWCITMLSTAQELVLAEDDSITTIELQVEQDQAFEADLTAALVEESLLTGAFRNVEIRVQNWKVQNEQLLSALQGQSISSIMIQVFVMISVVLGIASVLAISVMQKSRQIGILKAMGLRNSVTSGIFLTQGFILGVFGAVFGILFGLGLSYSFTKFALNADGTPVIALYIDPSFIALSGCIAIVSCIVASLIPAIRSFKLNPIDIIRNS